MSDGRAARGFSRAELAPPQEFPGDASAGQGGDQEDPGQQVAGHGLKDRCLSLVTEPDEDERQKNPNRPLTSAQVPAPHNKPSFP